MKTLKNTYRYFQILSLDVTLGACAFSKLIANCLDTNLQPVTYFCLALATWCVYTLDHLLDSFSLKESAITARHQFHYKHRNGLIASIILAGITGLSLTVQLDVKTIYAGITAGSIALIHLVIVKLFGSKVSVFYQKEISVALVFSLGVFTGPLATLENIFDFKLLSYFFLFFFIIFWNISLFSWYDKEIDSIQKQASISRLVSDKWMKMLFTTLGVSAVFLVIFHHNYLHVQTDYFFNQFCWISIIFIYATMSFYQNWFTIDDRYRTIGDAALFLPSILWFT